MVEELARRRVEAQEREQDEKTTRELNQQIKVLSRLLIPITYTAAGRFDHDPAWGFPHLPTLSDAQQLARLDPASDDYHFSRTQLARNRNKVNFVLREAISVLAD